MVSLAEGPNHLIPAFCVSVCLSFPYSLASTIKYLEPCMLSLSLSLFCVFVCEYACIYVCVCACARTQCLLWASLQCMASAQATGCTIQLHDPIISVGSWNAHTSPWIRTAYSKKSISAALLWMPSKISKVYLETEEMLCDRFWFLLKVLMFRL